MNQLLGIAIHIVRQVTEEFALAIYARAKIVLELFSAFIKISNETEIAESKCFSMTQLFLSWIRNYQLAKCLNIIKKSFLLLS